MPSSFPRSTQSARDLIHREPIFLDFEFSGITDKYVKLVSCVTLIEGKLPVRWWLFKDKGAQLGLKIFLQSIQKTHFVVAWSAIAEQRSFLALGLDPLDFQWEDDFLEYRHVTNHNDKLNWGKQLVDGKVKTVRKPKPKWERTEEDKATGFKPTHSLAEATFKLTGEIRDTKHKDETRDLIISYPATFTASQKSQILEYNEEDVVFMPRIRKAIHAEFFRLVPRYDRNQYRREILERGRYAAHTAYMETNGYPISVEATKNFSKQIPNILFDVQREINSLFPFLKPFRWNKREQRYSWDQNKTKIWIKGNHDVSRWAKTDGGDLSLSLEAFEKFYDFKHDYPTDNLGAQFVRFLKLKQSLYGFAAKSDSGRKTFWDYVGADGRVRPYMNIFGAQSSRSQPGATGFMFLKPAWMRALVVPERGKFMAGIDYGSQEFFIAALKSGDRNMIKAYLSGDVYFAFAKISGQVPQTAQRKDHEAIRNRCKSTVLGISYLMTKYGLAIKLTSDTGETWTEDEAQEQIDLFYDAFPLLGEMQDDIKEDYADGMAPIRLPCGWHMFGDNENIRSVVNVPIQGMGASIMRKAVDLYHQRTGDHVVFTLHDALYIEGDVGDEAKIDDLRKAMVDAFTFYFPDKYKKEAAQIKLDPFAWSPDYDADSELYVGSEDDLTLPCSNLYIDDRSRRDYDKFSQYFSKPDFDFL